MASNDRGLARPTSRLMNKKARSEIARGYKEVKDSSRISIIDRIYAEVLGKGIIDEKKTATAFESKDLIDLVTEGINCLKSKQYQKKKGFEILGKLVDTPLMPTEEEAELESSSSTDTIEKARSKSSMTNKFKTNQTISFNEYKKTNLKLSPLEIKTKKKVATYLKEFHIAYENATKQQPKIPTQKESAFISTNSQRNKPQAVSELEEIIRDAVKLKRSKLNKVKPIKTTPRVVPQPHTEYQNTERTVDLNMNPSSYTLKISSSRVRFSNQSSSNSIGRRKEKGQAKLPKFIPLSKRKLEQFSSLLKNKKRKLQKDRSRSKHLINLTNEDTSGSRINLSKISKLSKTPKPQMKDFQTIRNRQEELLREIRNISICD
ncbi:unnamed protein product [Moneuplotes crassus]|uniref:Uncharacterized protein n=1 Tax=Euplotes crassus TaxID=5936 RepID=A0AAD1XAZ7_EUPCR|nr:unnamed protein product [Moneuplotes crassus]